MQSGGGTSGRPAVGPPGRGSSTSSPSPSSPSSAVTPSHLGFNLQQQQHREHLQHVGQSLQQHMQLCQQPRKLLDSSQGQHNSLRIQDDGQNKSLGVEHQVQSPVHQAYLHYALQAASKQNSPMGMTAQQNARMGLYGTSSGRDQQGTALTTNMKMQEIISNQAANNYQSPASSSFMQAPQAQQNMGINQVVASQMQAWAHEQNIDLSLPTNGNLTPQFIPPVQSRMISQKKPNERLAVFENSPRANSPSDMSGQSGYAKPIINNVSSSSPFGSMHQFAGHSRENQVPQRQAIVTGIGMPPSHLSINTSQNLVDQPTQDKNSDILQMQYLRRLNGSSSSMPTSSERGLGQVNQLKKSRWGFTKQQMHVLKAQILAFRRLKKGDGTLPQELLQAIAPPPLEQQLQQIPIALGTRNPSCAVGKFTEDPPMQIESNAIGPHALLPFGEQDNARVDTISIDEREKTSKISLQVVPPLTKEPKPQLTDLYIESEQDHEHHAHKDPIRNDIVGVVDKGKEVVVAAVAVSDSTLIKKPQQTSTPPAQTKYVGPTRKYQGPLFDFPIFTRNHDSLGSTMMTNNNSTNLSLAYNAKDIFFQEGIELRKKKKMENLKKIGDLLAVNLERKRIRPDLVLRLQIEEKKFKLSDFQARLREEVDQQQQEIVAMPDRQYRKFVRSCERQRMELSRQVQAIQKASKDKQLKSVFQWRKKLLESHWAIRDMRTSRNKGVVKYHERMLREFSKRNDEDRNERMEALKNNDVERYREMLMEQQTSIPGDAGERYALLSSFLGQTEEYLHKLGSKITATKNLQEEVEAANVAAASARAQGLSEEEVRAAAACARHEVMINNRFSAMNAPKESSSVNKYYNLAHAVNEHVARQPSMLRAGTLRDYQLIGLQWMLSLYNNKLNGILADEMGLGKTVQVMALIAYLMEFKGNYGPHLIIVPNAVLVNWKSEFHNWLPNVSCIYYVGAKDQRAKLYSKEVRALKFNVLVTTYEFIMYDRIKLSKVDWKYIIIDEAQRMKDRDSVLARALDKYRCQRRLLLTGTPLQNDLKELWSLLNLLLPEVFDNRKAFHDWFSKPFQRDGPTSTQKAEDDWLETEKKVITIHRLHQILEPFMLRRRVEDVEGSLPPKVSIIIRCKMSAIQGSIYDWIKSTGTLRFDPEYETLKIKNKSSCQEKERAYKPLANRCMELRKTCNHPLLNYPYFNDFSKEFLVKSCGKLWILDRILVKLQKTGHRVLLFCTMTKLLDILEEYLEWRRLIYRRIDGSTTLEDRESAITDFNSPNSDSFIFLLSIRAAGRGLNLQSADTVVIYDPDPNPKNEEQAVARAHRIGQTREVKVIYMEAVIDKVLSHQKEDEFRKGGIVDSEDDLAGKDRYIGSIESLIRNNIQQYKIEMADEVINAGRFDQRTTHEERRLTLEALLHDEERYQETVHDVPSLQKVNRMIARSNEEVELFDRMDEELDWVDELTRYDQVPDWLRADSKEVNNTIATLDKKSAKRSLSAKSMVAKSENLPSDLSPKFERKRTRHMGKKTPDYKEWDDEKGDYSISSSEEMHEEEEGEEEIENEENNEVLPISNDQSEEEGPDCDVEYGYDQTAPKSIRDNPMMGEAGYSGSSLDSRRLTQTLTPSVSSQKYVSLSGLDSRPNSRSKRLPDKLIEGEIAVSGDSNNYHQQSGSYIHDCEQGEDEQVLQPKIRRKRSTRLRQSNVKTSLLRGDSSSHLPFQSDHEFEEAKKNDEPNLFKHNQTNMSDFIQRRCKSVISKLQRRIDKEGPQIVPLLTDLWKKKHSFGNELVDLRKIDQRVERLEYDGVMDMVRDVQLLLKGSIQFYGCTSEVKTEARKVHDLFFDILKIAFPDIDFCDAKNALIFSVSSGAAASTSASQPSAKQVPIGQIKKHTNKCDSPHPGELVICKKKRKDREKSRPGSSTSPISPPSTTKPNLKSHGLGPGSSSVSPNQQMTHRQAWSNQLDGGGDGDVRWANPVKRMRTDAGKRRPSHL